MPESMPRVHLAVRARALGSLLNCSGSLGLPTQCMRGQRLSHRCPSVNAWDYQQFCFRERFLSSQVLLVCPEHWRFKASHQLQREHQEHLGVGSWPTAAPVPLNAAATADLNRRARGASPGEGQQWPPLPRCICAPIVSSAAPACAPRPLGARAAAGAIQTGRVDALLHRGHGHH